MAITIYLDESGCLGWQLDKPYQKGGSSRHFTLAAVIIADGSEAILNRPVRGLYKKRNRSLSKELKSVHMSASERVNFARQVCTIAAAHECVRFRTITVQKEHVNAALRAHPNGLYNFMTGLLLLDVMTDHKSVCFIPDARSTKQELKHSMHDYLCMELGVRGAPTRLQTTPWASKDSLALQFTDIVASIVWSHHEFGSSIPHGIVDHIVDQQKLFFGNQPLQLAARAIPSA